jgi:hypothetical protein
MSPRLKEGDSIKIKGVGFIHYETRLPDINPKFHPNQRVRKLYNWEYSYTIDEMHEVLWDMFGDPETGGAPRLLFYPKDCDKLNKATSLPYFKRLSLEEVQKEDLRSMLIDMVSTYRNLALEETSKAYKIRPRIALHPHDVIIIKQKEVHTFVVSVRYRRPECKKLNEQFMFTSPDELQHKLPEYFRIFEGF